jgi:Ca2+-binding EF-hand superfamily protein
MFGASRDELREVYIEGISVNHTHIITISPAFVQQFGEAIVLLDEHEAGHLSYQSLAQLSVAGSNLENRVIRTGVERLDEFAAEIRIDEKVLTQ